MPTTLIPPGGFAPVVRQALPPEPYYVGEQSQYRTVSPYYDMVRQTYMGGPLRRDAGRSGLGSGEQVCYVTPGGSVPVPQSALGDLPELAAKAFPFVALAGVAYLFLRQARRNPRRRNRRRR